jgi:hypothetical protein
MEWYFVIPLWSNYQFRMHNFDIVCHRIWHILTLPHLFWLQFVTIGAASARLQLAVPEPIRASPAAPSASRFFFGV